MHHPRNSLQFLRPIPVVVRRNVLEKTLLLLLIASLSILIELRETLHTSRLYERLNSANDTTATSLGSLSRYLNTYAGVDATGAGLRSIGLLAHAGTHQVEVLSYADCSLFMELIGVLALFLISMMPPFVAPNRQPEALGTTAPRTT
jgi:hypothetical protein